MVAALQMADAKSVVRLVGDIAGMTEGDLPFRKRLLMEGLAHIIDADAWIWVHSRTDPDKNDVCAYMFLDGGWASERQKALTFEGSLDPEANAELHRVSLGDMARFGHVTRTRQQLMADGAWYQSVMYRRFRVPAGLDDLMVSLYPMPPRDLSAVGFHRAAGKGPFGDRERCLVHLITGEIDWLHRAGTDVPAAGDVLHLTPRQRQVLMLLLSGDSRKQIAGKLRISEHTVTDYMKALHRQFNVSSRGELLARFMSGNGALPAAG